MISHNYRSISGVTGLYGATVGLVIIGLAIAVIFFVPTGSSLALFIENHRLVFIRVFDIVFFGSFITLVSSLFGSGRARIMGVTLSVFNLVASIVILGGGE